MEKKLAMEKGWGKGVPGMENSLCKGLGVGINCVYVTRSWTQSAQFLVLSKHPLPTVVKLRDPKRAEKTPPPVPPGGRVRP